MKICTFTAMNTGFSSYGLPPIFSYGKYESYRHGFQGSEGDDEVKGEGNSCDFGARMMDPRLGRWFAPDMLMSKHPDISPYAFVANSPIINKELDGHDFIPAVDHVNHTITIKATYYYDIKSSEGQADALAATEYWNEQSYKFVYEVGKGENKMSYDIIFELTPKPVEDPEMSANAYTRQVTTVMDNGRERPVSTSIKIEGLNSIVTIPREDFIAKRATFDGENPELTDGFAVNEKYITFPEDIQIDEKVERGHEVGHTLGIEHMNGSVMGYNPTQFKDIVDYRAITSILVSGRIILNKGKIKTYSPAYPTPANYEESGTAPADFNNGTVKVKETETETETEKE